MLLGSNSSVADGNGCPWAWSGIYHLIGSHQDKVNNKCIKPHQVMGTLLISIDGPAQNTAPYL